tara:strand:+ start:560 stop:961 length:402 start_codon:yes stop_codon:yes gene_type:complete
MNEHTEDYFDYKIKMDIDALKSRQFAAGMSMINTKYARKERMAEDGKLSEEAVDKLYSQKNKEMAEFFGNTVITGWTGDVKIDGKKASFTKENVVKLLTSDPNLFADLIFAAKEKAEEIKEQERAEAGNSQKS